MKRGRLLRQGVGVYEVGQPGGGRRDTCGIGLRHRHAPPSIGASGQIPPFAPLQFPLRLALKGRSQDTQLELSGFRVHTHLQIADCSSFFGRAQLGVLGSCSGNREASVNAAWEFQLKCRSNGMPLDFSRKGG